jgi:Transport protein Avl9
MSGADRKWIDNLVNTITDSWDENDKSRPRTMSFVGSEDYIRAQFEEYLLALLSSVKYDNYLQRHSLPGTPETILPEIGTSPTPPIRKSNLF